MPPRSRPADPEPPPREPETLRVVTYNIHSCVGTDGRVSPARIVEVLATLDPDVIALQEVDVGRSRTGAVDQVDQIAGALGMRSVFERAIRWPDGDYGIAVLSRLAVHRVEGRRLPVPRLPYMQQRVALMATLHHPTADVVFVNTHLGLLSAERLTQTAFLQGWLHDYARSHPTILCGDLNAAPHSLECRIFDDTLADAFGIEVHGHTFPVHFPVSRIDQIRVSHHFECRGVAIPRNTLTRVASDHYPVVADLVIKEPFRRGASSSPPPAEAR